MRRGSLVQLVVIGVLAGVIAALRRDPGAVAAVTLRAARRGGSTSSTGSRPSSRLVIFAVVAAILIYAIINFRAEPGDWSDGPPVHGHTTLEIVWTIIPAVLVTAISIVSAVVLAQNGHAGSNPLVVKVIAQQFAWQFTYPNRKTYPDPAPAGRPAGQARDHRERRDPLVLGAGVRPEAGRGPRAGERPRDHARQGQRREAPYYPVICTELCGLGHALMRSKAIVMTQAAYTTGTAARRSRARSRGGGGGTPARCIFTQNGCGACHTFKPIPAAAGKVGPVLDNMHGERQGGRQELCSTTSSSRSSTRTRTSHPGISPGVMPATFGTHHAGHADQRARRVSSPQHQARAQHRPPRHADDRHRSTP